MLRNDEIDIFSPKKVIPQFFSYGLGSVEHEKLKTKNVRKVSLARKCIFLHFLSVIFVFSIPQNKQKPTFAVKIGVKEKNWNKKVFGVFVVVSPPPLTPGLPVSALAPYCQVLSEVAVQFQLRRSRLLILSLKIHLGSHVAFF